VVRRRTEEVGQVSGAPANGGGGAAARALEEMGNCSCESGLASVGFPLCVPARPLDGWRLDG
jgi:hypothetical protein